MRREAPEPRRLRIDLAYDGTGFSGWQLQRGKRTVQGVVEEALGRLQGGGRVVVRAASRTDSGAHARQQVVDTRLGGRLDAEAVERALHRLLPPDVRAWRVRAAPPGFHAQHDAERKTYRYRLDRTAWGEPFLARYALHHPHAFDRARLRAALERLAGRRDWSGFADSRCRVADRVRHVFEADYREDPRGGGWFVFTADGFLTHMVRNLVGMLLAIARGTASLDTLERVLRSGDRRLAVAAAPARGLCLWRVRYPGDPPHDDDGARGAPWGFDESPPS